MNFTKRMSLMAFAAVFSASAMATGTAPQVGVSTVVNSGVISNTVKTDASVNGIGSSYSSATGAAGSVANGGTVNVINPVCTGTCGAVSGSVGANGEVKTYNNATAFNVSTGSGVGSASSVGNATGSLNASSAYTGPGQSVDVKGNITAGSSVSVVAEKNTGGVANSGNDSAFVATGSVGSKVCTGTGTPCGTSTNKTVWGNVEDNKNSTSFANTGSMTVDGVVLAPANTSATANAKVDVSGKFSDPQ